MEKKTHGFTMPNGDTHVFIPPAPTETERGGIIAKEKTTESVEAAVGKDGKLYVPAADETLTKEDAAVDRVLKILAVNDDGTFKVGWADEAGGDVTDVQIDGKSIINNGVAEIPIGSNTTPGVFKVPGESYGLFKDNENYIRLVSLNNSEIDKRFYAKPLLGNYIDYAVKAAMTDGKGAPWTADEQAAARERMGISTNTIADMFCPEFEESGNPVTCYPVENYPLDIVASWKPIQEGSGNPYPAGCGPNLLDISRCTAFENKPYGLHIVIDDDIIKIDGVPNGEVINKGEYQFAVAYATQTELKGKGYKVTAFAEKGIVYRAWGLRTADEPFLAIAAQLTPGVNTDIQFRLMASKSEPTAYYPYENIRPIHGRDNVTIKRCGENVLKTDGAEEHKKVMNGITYERLENGGIHLYGTTTDRTYYCLAKTYIKIYKPIPAGEYTFCPYCELPDGVKIYFAVNGIVTGSLFSISSNDKAEYVTNRISNAVETIDAYIFIDEAGKTVDTVIYPMLAVGNISPSTYAMYTEQCICAELSEETSYGGTLDVISGIGTADWTVRTFDGTETWNSWGVDKITDGVTGFYSYDVNDYNTAYVNDSISSHMTNSKGNSWGGRTEGIGFAGTVDNKYVIFSINDKILQDTSTNEKAVESWKAYLAEQYAAGTPVQIAYKLAEPIPFQIEGEQILALKGLNNILTDADTVTVTGREDPVHYVDKKFAELSAAIVSSASEAE